MLQTHHKVSILVPLGFPLDVFRKIACGFARASVSSPSRYFVREQWIWGAWPMARDLCGFWKSLRAGSVLCSTLDPNNNYTTVMRYVHIIYTKVQRAKRRVPSHYTGKVRAHASVLACLTLYSPPCLCEKHVQTTSKLTKSARRVHQHSLLRNKCHVHIRIPMQHTHAHCAS